MPLRDDITDDLMERLTNHNIYISRNKTVKEFKQKLASLYNKNIANIDLNSDDIRIWKLRPDSEITEIKKEFLEKSKDIKESTKTINFGEMFKYLECKLLKFIL